jgi:hypothetical protein
VLNKTPDERCVSRPPDKRNKNHRVAPTGGCKGEVEAGVPDRRELSGVTRVHRVLGRQGRERTLSSVESVCCSAERQKQREMTYDDAQ